jgi:hypothetical protein
MSEYALFALLGAVIGYEWREIRRRREIARLEAIYALPCGGH